MGVRLRDAEKGVREERGGQKKKVVALRRNKWARVFDVFNREHDKRAEVWHPR